MKKLKKLSAIVATAGILGLSTTPIFAAEQKYDVPKFNLEGAKEKTIHQALTPFGNIEVNDPSEIEGFTIITTKMYGIDRNKDGKTDLIYIEVKVPEIEYNNPQTNEVMKQPGYTVKHLWIDDDFNGYIERMLTDQKGPNNTPGADGIYDDEQHAPRVEDIIK